MSRAIHPRHLPLPWLQQWMRAVAAVVQRLQRSRVAARQRAASRRRFDALDDAALRDLGVVRSEFESFWAEATGAVPPTRARVTRLRDQPWDW